MVKKNISRKLNGPWSSLMTGAYKPTKKRKQKTCPKCFLRFKNDGNLANHIQAKHPSYTPKAQPMLRFDEPRPAKPQYILPPEAKEEPESPPLKKKLPALPVVQQQPSTLSTKHFRVNGQKWKLLQAYEKCQTYLDKINIREKNHLSVNTIRNWRKKRATLQAAAENRSSTHVRIKNTRRAKYEEEEKMLYKQFKARRARGNVVDGELLRTLMKQFVSESGKDPTGSFKASNMWLSKFTHRYGISNQKKTNKKSKSIEERLPAVRNFHWWAIYQMALEKP